MPITDADLARLRRVYRNRWGKATLDHLLKIRRLLAGDFFQGGDGWIGAWPEVAPNMATDEVENVNYVQRLIKRQMVTVNYCKRVVLRHAEAVTGQEASWSLQPKRTRPDIDTEEVLPNGEIRTVKKPEAFSDEESAFMKEIESAMTQWWNDSRVWAEVQKATRALAAFGKAPLRLYIPPEEFVFVDGVARLPVDSLESALSKIRVQSESAFLSSVVRSASGAALGSWHEWTDDDGVSRIELSRVEVEAGTNRRLTSLYVQQTAGTARAQITNESYAEVAYDTGGNLLIHEMRGEYLITKEVYGLQKVVTHAITMANHNTAQAGFLERTFFNAEPPMDVTIDPTTRERRIEPRAYKVGSMYTNFVQGIEQDLPDGGRTRTTPSVVFREPSNVNIFEQTALIARNGIYEETSQLHVTITGDGAANGVSRIQAMSDFITSISPTKFEVESAVRWLLTSTAYLALWMLDRQLEMDAYKFAVDAQLTTNVPSPEQITVDLAMVAAGSMSRQTQALASKRITDWDAEASQIEREAAMRAKFDPAMRALEAAKIPSAKKSDDEETEE